MSRKSEKNGKRQMEFDAWRSGVGPQGVRSIKTEWRNESMGMEIDKLIACDNGKVHVQTPYSNT